MWITVLDEAICTGYASDKALNHKAMKKSIFIAGGVVVFVAIVGVLWLQAAPTIGTTAANPAYIVVKTPTLVTLTAQITDSSLIAGSVNLLKVDANGKVLATVGVMHDDGLNGDALAGDKTFSYRSSANEPSVGSAYYQVSAAFKGVLKRVLSKPIQVAVKSPTIQWSTPAVELTLSPGETATRTLTLTSNGLVKNALLEAAPTIAPFLTIQPNSFVTLLTNQPQTITISFTIPSGAALGTYDGTIQVRVGTQTLPQTMRVGINVWPTFASGLGISFKYPPSLNAMTRDTRYGSEIVLIDLNPASPDLAVSFALQLFSVSSLTPTITDVIGERLPPVAIIAVQPLFDGMLVESDDLLHFHYFQYSPTTKTAVDVYGATEAFFKSTVFNTFVSTLRF